MYLKSSRVLDAAIGLMVVGKVYTYDDQSPGLNFNKIPYYSTNEKDAWDLFIVLRDSIPAQRISISHSETTGWCVKADYPMGKWRPSITYNFSFPLAVCEAVLKRFEIDFNENMYKTEIPQVETVEYFHGDFVK